MAVHLAMGRFTLTQLFMAVALVAILLALVTSEGCGQRLERINGVAFSPDGTRLAVAKLDARDANVPMKFQVAHVCRTVSVVRVPTLVTESVVAQESPPGERGNTNGLFIRPSSSLAFLTDSRTLAVHKFGGGIVEAYDVATAGKHLLTRPYAYEQTFCLSPHRSIAATGFGGGVAIWNLTTNSPPKHILTTDYVSLGVPYIAISPDGTLIVTAGQQGATIFDLATGAEIATVPEWEDEDIVGVEFSPSGDQVAVTSRQWLRIYGLLGQRVAQIDLANRVCAAHFAPSGKELVIATCKGYSDDARIEVYDRQSGSQLRVFPCRAQVTCFEISPDGTLLAAGDMQGNITLRRAESGQVLSTIKPAGRLRHSWLLPASFLALWLAALWRVKGGRSRSTLRDTALVSA